MARGGSAVASSRGRGKFRNFSRGGGKNFSRNLAEAEAYMWAEPVPKSDEEGSEGESEEEESEDEAAAEASREARKAEKKARKEAALAKKTKIVQVGDLPPSDSEPEDDMPANPNHKPVSIEKMTKDLENMSMNRKEREAAAAKETKEKYHKLHLQGKTEEAQNDLARLKVIREKRAREAAQRLAEQEERKAQEDERRKELEAREAKRREAALGSAKKSKKSK